MTVKSLGVAFANIFDPYIEGTKTCPAGEIIEGGADIRNKYAPLSVGSKAANTGVKINGVDVSNYFAAKGTASYFDASLVNLPANHFDVGEVSSPPTKPALAEIRFETNGNIYTKTNYPGNGSNVSVGPWAGTFANSSNTEIRFVVTSGVLDVNNASAFSPLTTNRVFSIQNITPSTETQDNAKTATVRVEIRKIGDPSTLITKSINLKAEILFNEI